MLSRQIVMRAHFHSAIWLVPTDPGTGSQQLLLEMLPGCLLPVFFFSFRRDWKWGYLPPPLPHTSSHSPLPPPPHLTLSSSSPILTSPLTPSLSLTFHILLYKLQIESELIPSSVLASAPFQSPLWVQNGLFLLHRVKLAVETDEGKSQPVLSRVNVVPLCSMCVCVCVHVHVCVTLAKFKFLLSFICTCH